MDSCSENILGQWKFFPNLRNKDSTVADEIGEPRCHRVLYGNGGVVIRTRFESQKRVGMRR